MKRLVILFILVSVVVVTFQINSSAVPLTYYRHFTVIEHNHRENAYRWFWTPDTLDGPVVATARIALEQGDATPVLKWVSSEYEEEVKTVFAHALAVRELSPQAREMADSYFFETLVRIHREGESAPYTGLKPAGATLGNSSRSKLLRLRLLPASM